VSVFVAFVSVAPLRPNPFGSLPSLASLPAVEMYIRSIDVGSADTVMFVLVEAVMNEPSRELNTRRLIVSVCVPSDPSG
jgi:hypothetical protein